MLDTPMHMYHHPSGPCITAQVYIHDHQITEIVLYPHHEQGAAWQIIADHPYPSIEAELNAWFNSYCSGKTPLQEFPFNWKHLTPFTQDVGKAINEIPFGKVLTYKEIAEKIGKPLAVRAVGSACGRNPFPWIVPCHRVLAANYQLGGYSLDILIKRRLLAFEGIHFST